MTTGHPLSRRDPERRVGRPNRVTREMIARAAYEIGLSDLTMRAVAERLGVSPTSLYYHVRDKEDLIRLVAEYSASQLVPPRDRGQHWAKWLVEWAQYTRAAFAGQPGLLEQFLSGAIELERMLPSIDLVMTVLEREGFDAGDAMLAYTLVSDVAVGSAVCELRRGGPPGKEWARRAASRAPSRPQEVEEIAQDHDQAQPSLEDEICIVLAGIALRRGENPTEVLRRALSDTQADVQLKVFHP